MTYSNRSFARRAGILLLALVVGSQSAMAQFGHLPDLGDPAEADISAFELKRSGQMAMLSIRQDPSYLDDQDVVDYLDALGRRLVAASGLNGQRVTFFALREPSINAFAMPGNFIGMHTGTILAARTESELAGVLAHEIGHIEQRHFVRSIASQGTATASVLAGLLVAVLASRVSKGAASEAALATGQAVALSSQLAYSRDFEREADRVGFLTLQGAGLDPQGMPGFFERMLSSKGSSEVALPGYLLTHPLTTDRLSDMQGRLRGAPPRQVADSDSFTMLRARLESISGSAGEWVGKFSLRPEISRQASVARRYGIALSYYRAGQLADAESALVKLRTLNVDSPMLASLGVQIAQAQGRYSDAARLSREGLAAYPASRALVYSEVKAYLAAGQAQQALDVLRPRILPDTQDEQLYVLRAQAYAALNMAAEQHRALAEVYVLQDNLWAAIDQLQIAQRSPGADYITEASVDARLRELRQRLSADIRDGSRSPRQEGR